MAHILIVDDEEVIRDLLSQFLERMGHECDQAGNGREGLDRVRETEYDLIITDIRMPEMSGLEFLTLAQDRVESCTPCMIITALADEPAIAVRAVRLACDFLSKPFEMATIHRAVERALLMREAWLARRNHIERLEYEVRLKEAELRNALDGLLAAFASMMEHGMEGDPDTVSHCQRLKNVCRLLAARLGITDPREIRDIELGALLHDIGKYKVPRDVLFKKGPLTDEDWEAIKRHPVDGADFVRGIPYLTGAEAIIRHHHERYDGDGYPDGLVGEEIPIGARILFVADAFDAICSQRCYKSGKDPHWALEEIRRCAGTQFDAEVVKAFERIFAEVRELLVGCTCDAVQARGHACTTSQDAFGIDLASLEADAHAQARSEVRGARVSKSR